MTGKASVGHGVCATVLMVALVFGLFSVASAAPIVIQMARSIRVADAAWQEAVVEAFNQEQDRIRVELFGGAEGLSHGKTLVLILAGEAPHIIYQDPNNLLNIARQGALVDLTPLLDREPPDSPFNDFFENTWQFYTLSGRIWAVAMDFRDPGTHVQRGRLSEAGQAEPEPGWTWGGSDTDGPKSSPSVSPVRRIQCAGA